MHVGIAYLRWRGKRSRHSRRMRIRNFAYLARGPWVALRHVWQRNLVWSTRRRVHAVLDHCAWWSHPLLTHWGRNKMAAISQTTLSKAPSWIKICKLSIKIPLKFVPKGPINNIPAWSAPCHYLNQWCSDYRRTYASSGLNEFTNPIGYYWSVLPTYQIWKKNLCELFLPRTLFINTCYSGIPWHHCTLPASARKLLTLHCYSRICDFWSWNTFFLFPSMIQ